MKATQYIIPSVYGVKNGRADWYALGSARDAESAALLMRAYARCYLEAHGALAALPPFRFTRRLRPSVSLWGYQLGFDYISHRRLDDKPLEPALPLWEHDAARCLAANLKPTEARRHPAAPAPAPDPQSPK